MLYFYRSSDFKDAISKPLIVSASPKRAYSLALKYFKENKLKGIPIRIGI